MPPSMAAAPTYVTLGDKNYRMSPLSDKDYEEINNWIRSSYLQMVRQSFTPDMLPAQRQEEIAVAQETARGLNMLSMHGKSVMSTPEGVSLLVWLGIKRNHPDVPLDEISPHFLDPQKITEVMERWRDVNVGPSRPLAGAGNKARQPPKKKSTPSSVESANAPQSNSPS